MNNTYLENASEFFKALSIKGLRNYKTLYGTSDKTWAHKNSSVWFITLKVDENDNIVGCELNKTYFAFSKKQLELLKALDIKHN